MYIKSSRELSARYYKKTKKKFTKSLVKDIKILLKKKTKNKNMVVNNKNKNMVVNNIKISQKMKNKNYLSVGRDIMKCRKTKICYKHLK